MKIKFIVFSIALLVNVTANAESMQLICSYSDDKPFESLEPAFSNDRKVPIVVLPLRIQYVSSKESCEKFKNADCIAVKILKKVQYSKICNDRGFDSRMNFKFEADDLKRKEDTNVEFKFEGCGIRYGTGFTDDAVTNESNYGPTASDISLARMVITPSIISFKGAVSNTTAFNIDRETLRAGYDVDRSFQCEVKKIKQSKNLL